MRKPLLRDIPPRAAAVVIALASVASLVTGAPWTGTPPPAAEPEPRRANDVAAAPAEPLDLEALERRKVAGIVPDLFQIRAPAPPAPVRMAAVPAPPPTPVAPPLPFRYLGRLEDQDGRQVFLESGPNVYSAGAGDTLDQRYRVESISDAAVTFRYLPLDIEQTLTIPRGP